MMRLSGSEPVQVSVAQSWDELAAYKKDTLDPLAVPEKFVVLPEQPPLAVDVLELLLDVVVVVVAAVVGAATGAAVCLAPPHAATMTAQALTATVLATA